MRSLNRKIDGRALGRRQDRPLAPFAIAAALALAAHARPAWSASPPVAALAETFDSMPAPVIFADNSSGWLAGADEAGWAFETGFLIGPGNGMQPLEPGQIAFLRATEGAVPSGSRIALKAPLRLALDISAIHSVTFKALFKPASFPAENPTFAQDAYLSIAAGDGESGAALYQVAVSNMASSGPGPFRIQVLGQPEQSFGAPLNLSNQLTNHVIAAMCEFRRDSLLPKTHVDYMFRDLTAGGAILADGTATFDAALPPGTRLAAAGLGLNRLALGWIDAVEIGIARAARSALPSPYSLALNASLFLSNGAAIQSLAGAGDVNGDGLADFLLGAPESGSTGKAYLAYGRSEGFGPGQRIDLPQLSASEAAVLWGASADARYGYSVASAGDVNGDGFSDILVGAPGYDSDRGRACLVYGRPNLGGLTGSLNLETLGRRDGVLFEGEKKGDRLGESVSGAGDVNGDGFADFILGAPQNGSGSPTSGPAGRAYLIYGRPALFSPAGTVGLPTLGEAVGVRIVEDAGYTHAGYAVSGAGDINGDGLHDVVIGSMNGNIAFVLYGPVAPNSGANDFALSLIDAASGVKTVGESFVSQYGFAVAGGSDFDGDGRSDLAIGAPGNFADNFGSGYLLRGADAAAAGNGLFDVAAQLGSGALRFDAANRLLGRGFAGISLDTVGDVNGDGVDDLAIGDPGVDSLEYGATYIVYGDPLLDPPSGQIGLEGVDGTNGAHVPGTQSFEHIGRTVAAAGDVNGDAYHDLLVGGAEIGHAYLIQGSGGEIPGQRDRLEAAFSDMPALMPRTKYAYQTFFAGGNPRPRGVGSIGDGSHAIPMSRLSIDWSAGSGPSRALVRFEANPPRRLPDLRIRPKFLWHVYAERAGYDAADLIFHGAGRRGESDWQGLILRSADGHAWTAPPQSVDSLRHTIAVPNQTLPALYALIQAENRDPPYIVGAVFNDENGDGLAQEGETLTLIMSQGVVVREDLIGAASFHLPVQDDTLGQGGPGLAVRANPRNSRQIVVTLGGAPRLTVEGAFTSSTVAAGSPSGIDLNAALAPEAIRSLYGVPARDKGARGVNDTGQDIVFSLRPAQQTIGPAGGALAAPTDPGAAYTRHRLEVFPGSLSSNVQFRMRAASLFHDTVNAVRIETDPPGAAFAGLLRLQYRLWDGDFELGRTERAMRIHRLADDGGIPRWVPLEGFQSLNLEGKTVTAPLNGLAARGAMDGAGGYGTFAVLPGETIEEAFRYIKPSSGLAPAALIAFSSAPFLAPGGGSLYANHKIEIPGYELTDETDPQRIKILIRPPYVWERLSSVGGQSFPDSSNAVFVAETSDASDNPVAFSDPVNLEIEFRSGAGDGFEDLYTLQGQAAALDDMGIVRDAIDGPDVDFEMLEGASWTVSPLPTGGTVLSANIADLTGESGAGAWGAAAGPPQAQARGWAEYE